MNARTALLVLTGLTGATSLGWLGCGGSAPGTTTAAEDDPRFAPRSNDEYTEPLTNAVIGSPSGVVTIGPGITESVKVATTVDAGSAPPVTVDAGGGAAPLDSGTSFDSSFPGDSGFPGDGGDGGPGGGFGQWHFDDCSPTSNFLIDSSGEGANAQHALKAACVPGISGLGVDFRSAKDVVQVPDEPQFTVSTRVAVAAWVHPNTVTGNQPIVIKRLNNSTSFSLGVHNGNIEMSVVLTGGTTVISRAPLAAGQWSHVAGMYDGTFVYLFINGQQFGQVFAGGTLQNVFAPLRIGATTGSQFFDGVIDEVFVSTENISKDTLTALACISKPSTFSVNPVIGPTVPSGTTVHYDISVADNDVGFCGSKPYDLFQESFDPSFTVTFDSSSFQSLSPGGKADFGIDITSNDDANVGPTTFPFGLESFPNSGAFEFLTPQLVYVVAQPTGCFVTTREELMITNTTVVDDPVRTAGVFVPSGGLIGFDGGVGFDGGGAIDSGAVGVPIPFPIASGAGTSGGTSGTTSGVGVGTTGAADAGSGQAGAWTFGQLARNFAPTAAQAPDMIEHLFDTWLTDQTVNGFTVSARPAMQQILLGVWPRTADGKLDLDHPPLTLQAIVNRIDIRNLSAGSAGEGRFVFAVNGAGFPQQFTVIFEYNLPAQTQADVLGWANAWHALASHPFPSEEYNVALQAITDRFSGHNASPGSVNGSALVSLRTNEIALSDRWQLRQFALSPSTGFLQQVPLTETPDLSFNGTQTFTDFVNENAPAIIAEIPGSTGTTVTPQFEGTNFQAGAVFNDLIEWSAPNVLDPNARFHASINTCNGCHGPDTNTAFLQINPRTFGFEASLSPFLTGTSSFDQFTGQTHALNDLARRKADLTSLVCGADSGAPPPPSSDSGAPPPARDGGSVTVDAGPTPRDASTGSRPASAAVQP